jgi:hypothetical protein
VSPPLGAHIADVDTQLGSGTLTLAPDQDMLASTDTVYPLYIDPSWIPHPASGSRQHWNEVQEGCPTQADNYDSTQYGDPGVGYNGYSGCIGLERSYFQLSFPSSVWRTHIVSAKVNVAETSASQCDTTSTIHMYLSPAINSKFSWNTKPKPGSKINDASFAAACTSYVSAAFDATSTVVRAAANSWTAFAYVLVNGNESDKYHFKRFATNPSLSITYNHVPNVPTSPAVKLNASTYTCATSTPYPILGETVATTPPTLDSVVSDPDKDVVQATYTYWTGTGAIKYSVKSKDVSSGQHAPASFPSSYISNLDDGTVVLWKVSVTDGEDTTDNTSYCHFIVDQHAPIEPTVTADVYPDIDAGGLPGAPAGTPGTFTAKVDPGNSKNNAVKFVFGLDAPPPTSGAPASQTKTATNNMAQFSATPVAPGTHILYVYAVDSAGNDSPPHEYKFTAVGHLAHPYASLSAAFNNTAVSNDNAPTAANADGVGNSFSLQDLQAAGWQPGQKITVDGATFTLPNFGSGAPDNVLAANQTIGMSDAKGSALVILATATGATSPFRHAPEDDASPYVPDGTLIGATNCAYSGSYYDDCSEASGTITYNNSSGTTPPDTYKLAVPDWVISPGALAAVTVPHRNSASGQVNQPRRIFAFAIPLAPGVPISSVSLPDLSDQAADRTPALHIFGMAVRDTASASSGQSWTGAWTSPIDTQYAFGGQGFGDQTFRTALLPSISGSGVRIRLSNAQGSAPLTLNDVTVAHQGASPASASAPPVPVTFNAGATSVTLPVGGELYSDPVSIPAVAAQRLLVSFHLVTAIPYLGMHTNSSDAYTYISPLNSGDHAMDTSDSAFNLTGRVFSHAAVILTGLDVLGDSPHPTIAVLGDGLRNVTGSTIDATAPRLSDNVATAFRTNGQYTEPVGVVSAGITNNLLTQDQNAGGHAALTRLDRDVLSIPGIKTVVVYQGMNDLLAGTDDTVVTNAYHALGDQLAAWKIRTVFLTLTPCGGNTACTDQVEDDRVTVNQGIANYVMALPPGIAELDANGATAIDDPNSTTTPAKQDLSAGDPPLDFDAGDHVNLTADGYAAISQTLTNDLSILFPPITP